MIYNDVVEAAPLIAEQLAAAKHILILTHVHPDGDAAGSLIALGRLLRLQGRRVSMLAPTPLPASAAALADASLVQIYTSQRELAQNVDLIVIVDTGSIDRLGPVFEERADYLSARPLVIIDHHITNDGQGVVNLIVPQAAATCELLYNLFRAWQAPIDAETATALLLGLLTDTQSFQTSNTTPDSLQVGAQLLAAGGDLARLIDEIYFQKSFANTRAVGLALAGIQHEDGLVWTALTQQMVAETGADDEAADELTIIMARIAGARAYALFKERPDGTVKISLRSRPGVDVAAIAKRFGGGGHLQASGAILPMPLAEAQERVLAALRETLGQQG